MKAKHDNRWDARHGEVVLAGIDHVNSIAVTLQAVAFVWPDEGEFRDGWWHFNEEHRQPVEFQPLLIDSQTASLLMQIYFGLHKPENKEKYREWISKGRGTFAHIVEMAWSRAKFTRG